MYGTNVNVGMSSPGYAIQLQNILSQSFERVRQTLGSKQEIQKQQYDRKVHGDPYKVGDLVWLHNLAVPPGTSRKLHHPWSGPYRVVKCLSEVNYRIQSLDHHRKRLVVHFDRLRPCLGHSSNSNIEPPPSEPDPSVHPNCPRRPIGSNIEIIEPADPELRASSPSPTHQRYPTRSRRPPDRYGTPYLYC